MKMNTLITVLALTMASNVYARSSVNSDIHVKAGDETSSASSVNGDVEIDKGATVTEVETVNGDIVIAANSKIGTIESVNGDIEISDNVVITNDIETVNGDLDVKGGEVGGNLESVNGDLNLDDTHVKGNVVVVHSDVTLKNGTVIDGDLIVRESKSNGFFGLFNGSSSKNNPKIIIGENVQIKGKIIFERGVNLTVADSAKIPEIQYPNKK